MNRFLPIIILTFAEITLSSTSIASEKTKLSESAILKSAEETRQDCYVKEVERALSKVTVESIKAVCLARLKKTLENRTELSPLEERLIAERKVRGNSAVITPHKRNYILPLTYVGTPNNDSFEADGVDIDLDNIEAKFQLSFKAPITENLFQENDVIFFGITIQSYWQMYNSDISSPFRETNYQPELFYGFVNDFKVGEWTNLINVIGFEHQSNGRSQRLSRSWNRIYAQFVWENDNWIFMFKPWYRIPEKKK
jgi:phospholipase A1